VQGFYKNNAKIFIFKKKQNKVMSKKPLVKKSTSGGGKKNELHVPTSMNSPT